MRIVFTKQGPSRFMSHLDLVRVMTRAMTRAKIPVKITQGFNPHPYLVFSVPLPLGVESECELVDIGLDEPMTPASLQAALSAQLPEGMNVPAVYEDGKSLNDIMFAHYRLTVPDHLCEAFEAFLQRPSIEVVKHSKKSGDKLIDLKNEFTRLRTEKADGATVFVLSLPSGNVRNIGINLLVDAFYDDAGLDAHTVRVTRIGFADANGNAFH